MKKAQQPQTESPYVGAAEPARLLGLGINQMRATVRLPDGTLGCKRFPSLKRIQDASGGKCSRGTQILFVREQVITLAEERRQPPKSSFERTRTLAWSEEVTRRLLAMGPAAVRVLQTKL